MFEDYPFFIITFPSVHHALKFEADMKGSSISFQLVPVPREISSSCGVAAKVTKGFEEKILIDTIEKNNVVYDSIYFYEAPKTKPRLIKHG